MTSSRLRIYLCTAYSTFLLSISYHELCTTSTISTCHASTRRGIAQFASVHLRLFEIFDSSQLHIYSGSIRLCRRLESLRILTAQGSQHMSVSLPIRSILSRSSCTSRHEPSWNPSTAIETALSLHDEALDDSTSISFRKNGDRRLIPHIRSPKSTPPTSPSLFSTESSTAGV